MCSLCRHDPCQAGVGACEAKCNAVNQAELLGAWTRVSLQVCLISALHEERTEERFNSLQDLVARALPHPTTASTL